MSGVLAERFGERLQPGLLDLAQCQRQHEAGRRGALGGDIGEVHPQRLARQRAGRISAEEMHALDDGIRGDHDVLAGRL